MIEVCSYNHLANKARLAPPPIAKQFLDRNNPPNLAVSRQQDTPEPTAGAHQESHSDHRIELAMDPVRPAKYQRAQSNRCRRQSLCARTRHWSLKWMMWKQ